MKWWCPDFQRFAKAVLRRGAAEIGMHLHAWNSPPIISLTGDDYASAPYLIEYASEIIHRKVSFTTAPCGGRSNAKSLAIVPAGGDSTGFCTGPAGVRLPGGLFGDAGSLVGSAPRRPERRSRLSRCAAASVLSGFRGCPAGRELGAARSTDDGGPRKTVGGSRGWRCTWRGVRRMRRRSPRDTCTPFMRCRLISWTGCAISCGRSSLTL
jgi:hypothetical protein